MFGLRIFAWTLVGVIAFAGIGYWDAITTEQRRDLYLAQLGNDESTPAAIRTEYTVRHGIYLGAGAVWLLFGSLMFAPELSRAAKLFRSPVK